MLYATTAIGGQVNAPIIEATSGEGTETQETRLYRAINASSNDLKEHLAELCFKYGLDYEELHNVINCESGFDNSAVGKAGERGLAQFMPGTWKSFNGTRGTDLDISDPYDQLDMIVWAWNNDLKSHWTCYKNLYHKY